MNANNQLSADPRIQMIENNENQIASSSTANKNSTLFACSICGKEFPSEKQYFGHLRIHSGEVLWCCEKCPHSDTLFDSQSRLKMHENLFHAPVRPHKCSKCDDIFDRASQLDYHRRSVHLGEKSQICQICGKGFFRKTDLRTHLNVHLGTNQSICEICGRKFNHVSNLIRHCRTHAGSKPYPCTICGKRFTQISSLARHKRIHERATSNLLQDKDENSEESTNQAASKQCPKNGKKIAKRQHYCRMCGESFQFMVLLRQHERLHSKSAENHDKNNSIKERESDGSENVKETEQIEKLLTKTASASEWRNFNTEKEQISENLRNLHEPDSIRNHLMELDRKMNAIAIESERDVSINISDILSPYNCDELELSNPDDNLEPNLYENSSAAPEKNVLEKEYDMVNCLSGVDFVSNIDSDLLETSGGDKSAGKVGCGRAKFQSSRETKTLTTKSLENLARDQQQYSNKCLHVDEGSQLYIEICESEYLKNSANLQALELQEIENVALFREVLDGADKEVSNGNVEKKFHGKSSSSDEDEADAIESCKEPTLRLVQTETGEQFYELILNNHSGDDFELTQNEEGERKTLQNENSEAELKFSVSRDVNAAISAPSQFRSENLERLSSEIVESSSNEFFQLLPNSELHNSSQSDAAQMPMVRLVQNEDGEQFFELIREPLEYERNRSIVVNLRDEKSSENIPEKNDSNNIAENSNPEFAITNSGMKKDKKESTAETLQRPSKDKTRKFQCTECDKWFSTAYNFKQHAGTHFSDQQQFQCKDCGLSFAWKSTLNKHLAGNHRPDGPQKFVCEICPKVYSTLSQVNEHVKRDHLKERNHVCPHCGKSFFKKFDLKTHSRTHTDERPYVCRACGKRFHHQSHIIRHERIHSGERPYECNICQRTFTQPGSLKAHRQRHRDVKIDILEYRMDEDDPMSLAVQ